MADRGRPKNRTEPESLKVTLPRDTFEYLVLLAERGKLGSIENDVAAQILIAAHLQMDRDGFHDKPSPRQKKK
jgi:hypothetical protein